MSNTDAPCLGSVSSCIYMNINVYIRMNPCILRYIRIVCMHTYRPIEDPSSQHTATHCTTRQHTATHRVAPEHFSHGTLVRGLLMAMDVAQIVQACFGLAEQPSMQYQHLHVCVWVCVRVCVCARDSETAREREGESACCADDFDTF